MQLLPGVRLYGIRPELVMGALAVYSVLADHQVQLVVTCGAEGKHKQASLHYSGSAIDVRSKNMTVQQLALVVEDLKLALGYPDSEFDVVKEADHIHVEFQPKRGVNLAV